MKKYISIVIITLVLLVSGCSVESSTLDDKVMAIAVSIPPQASIVEAIGGEYVNVVTMIPPGYSPANYAPTQKEMSALEESALYFSIDVPTEIVNIIPVLESNNSDTKIIDLAERVDAIYPARYFEESSDVEENHDHGEHEEHDHMEEIAHQHEGRDPHIWLSAKRIEVMAREIEKELSLLMPEQKTLFEKNKNKYIETIKAIDDENRQLFEVMNQKTFLIYHPSLGYFAEEYDLKMIALESEGKSATVSGMTKVIEFAKENDLKVVFYQEEFDSKQARLLASEIEGEAVQLSPLNKNLVETLSTMGKSIRNSME